MHMSLANSVLCTVKPSVDLWDEGRDESGGMKG